MGSLSNDCKFLFPIFNFLKIQFFVFFPIIFISKICEISNTKSKSLLSYRIKDDSTEFTDVLVVSAYFPLEKSKRSLSEYEKLIRYFLLIMNCKTLIYTTTKFYEEYYSKEIRKLPIHKQNLFIFNCTYNDIFEAPSVKNLKEAYQKVHEIDRENFRHNPNLYAIWNSKVFFIRESTLIYPNEKYYFWVDSGCVRDPLYFNKFDDHGNICESNKSDCHYMNFPSKNFSSIIQSKYKNPPLELCLFFLIRRLFPKHSTEKIRNDIIQGGGFFGTKIGIQKFYDAFWEVHNSWLKNNIFCGKEQEIFNHVFSNYYDKINIYVYPAYTGSRTNLVWKMFLSAFSDENPHKENQVFI